MIMLLYVLRANELFMRHVFVIKIASIQALLHFHRGISLFLLDFILFYFDFFFHMHPAWKVFADGNSWFFQTLFSYTINASIFRMMIFYIHKKHRLIGIIIAIFVIYAHTHLKHSISDYISSVSIKLRIFACNLILLLFRCKW